LAASRYAAKNAPLLAAALAALEPGAAAAVAAKAPSPAPTTQHARKKAPPARALGGGALARKGAGRELSLEERLAATTRAGKRGSIHMTNAGQVGLRLVGAKQPRE